MTVFETHASVWCGASSLLQGPWLRGRGREDAWGPPSQNHLQGIARAAVLLLQLE